MDFALLQRNGLHTERRNRRLLAWVLGLMLLSLGSVVALVLYLQTFEREEEERQRVADGQWVERAVRFHLRRLEEDLTTLANLNHQARESGTPPAQMLSAHSVNQVRGGALLHQSGVLLAHGWLAVKQPDTAIATALQADAALNPHNAAVLAVMQDTARGLRRPSYAGPLLDAQGKRTDRLWLAVPLFERGLFIGNYLASLSLDRSLVTVLPDWFRQTHHIERIDDLASALSDDTPLPRPRDGSYYAQLAIPGTQVALYVDTLHTRAPWLPRLFFGVALLFLLGMLGAVLALWRDIVKRQGVERELQAQVALRQAMENAVTTGLRAWDLDGRLLYANPAFCRLVGYTPQELIGRSAPLPYWPTEQADELSLVHHELMSQGTEARGVEVQFQHRDGHLIDVLVYEAPLRNADDLQLGWMSSVLDVSERKRAERLAAQQHDKLEALGRLVAVGEVASTLAHELNQPLGALSGFATGLLNRLEGGRISLPEVTPVVDRMARLADNAGRIIQRVNAFARQREMSRAPLELRSYLARVLKPLQRDHPLRWRWNLGQHDTWIDADPDLLEHAVRNVASNAVDWAQAHMADNGRAAAVRVALLRRADEVGIAVGDSGPSVPPAQREHIFSAFYSGKDGGMGMGLAICRSVVEAHHGRIEVDTDSVLGGALFTLWLPLTTEPTAPDPSSDPLPP